MFDPPRKPIPNPPGDGPPLLLVVIDTEEEFDWSRPHSRENTAVTSLAAQSLAQAIFDAKAGALVLLGIVEPIAGHRLPDLRITADFPLLPSLSVSGTELGRTQQANSPLDDRGPRPRPDATGIRIQEFKVLLRQAHADFHTSILP